MRVVTLNFYHQVSVPLRGRGFESLTDQRPAAKELVSVPLRGRGFESLLEDIMYAVRSGFPSPYGEEVLKDE